jgi:hypothetical protein
VTESLRALQDQPLDMLLETREDKILMYGKFRRSRRADPGAPPMATIGATR